MASNTRTGAVKSSLDRLRALREQVESVKTQRAMVSGQLASTMAQLQELGASSIEDAETLRNKLIHEETNLTKEIERGIAELEQEFEW